MSSCIGQVVDSQEWIIKRDEHRVLDRFRDTFGWPDPEMPKDQATLYVYSRGPTYTVVAVGPIASDAKEYARKIDKWKDRQGLQGTVLYSQENDCAAAKLVVSTAQFGKVSYSLNIPLKSLFREVQLEKVTHYGFTTRGPATLPIDMPKPDYVTPRGNRYWNASKWKDGRDVLVSDELSWWSVPVLVGSVVFPIIALMGVFLSSLFVARRNMLPIDKRRVMYSDIMTKGLIWVLGIHAAIIVPSMITRALDPVCELWFGEPFLSIGLISLFSLNLVPMFFFPFLLSEEAKISELTDQEKAQMSLPNVIAPQAKLRPSNFRHLWPHILLFLVATVVWVYPTTKTDPFHEYKVVTGLLIILIPSFFPNSFHNIQSNEPKTEDLPDLESKGEQLCRTLMSRSEVKIESVQVHSSAPTQLWSRVDGKVLLVSEAALRNLSPNELEYFALTELLSNKIQPWQNRRIFLVAVLLFAVSMLILFLPGLPPTIEPYRMLGMLVLPVGFWLSLPFLQNQHESNTFETDLRVVRETGNALAAISTLETINKFSWIGMGQVTPKPKPTYSERIARIRAAFPETRSDPASE